MTAESIPPGDADDDGVEPVLRDVVAQPEDERTPHLLDVLAERRDRRRLGPLEVDDEQRLLEARRPCQHAAVALEDEGVPVEDELVLPADRVAQRDTNTALSCPRGEDGLALLGSPDVERRGGEVDDELGTRGGELGRRRPGNPHVLADRDPDLRACHVDERELVAGSEVALLVEDAVVGQVPLLRPAGDFAVRADRARVVENAVEERYADERDDVPRLGRDALERGVRRAHERRAVGAGPRADIPSPRARGGGRDRHRPSGPPRCARGSGRGSLPGRRPSGSICASASFMPVSA